MNFSIIMILFLFDPIYSIDSNESIAICKIKSNNPDLWPESTNDTNCELACLYDDVVCENDEVTTMNISSRGVNGTIPTQLAYLKSLSRLYLNGNNMIGTIPTEIGNLSKLQYLYLDNNRLNGTLPTEFGKLSELIRLILNNNELSGTIPNEIGYPKNLSRINLTGNKLHGSIPSSLRNRTFEMINISLSSNSSSPTDDDDDSLVVNQTVQLNNGIYVYRDTHLSSDSLLLTTNANLTTKTLSLSRNSTLSITNSTITVQESITIPTGFTLSITNPTTTALEASGRIFIQQNATLNINLPPNYTQTNDVTLISFKTITGTFTNTNINNDCFEVVKTSIGLILTQNTNPKCMSSSSTTQETITISVFAFLFFSLLL